MYLSVKIDAAGKHTAEGSLLHDQSDVTRYLLDEAKLAIVPFSVFGTEENVPWYRLSVGACKIDEIQDMLNKLKSALSNLK